VSDAARQRQERGVPLPDESIDFWLRPRHPGPFAIFPRLSEYGIARQFPPIPLLRSQKPDGPKVIPRSVLSIEVISCEAVPPQPGESVAFSRLRLCEGFDSTVVLHYFRSRLLVGSDSEVYDVPILGEEL
jgi:hypothetical protein